MRSSMTRLFVCAAVVVASIAFPDRLPAQVSRPEPPQSAATGSQFHALLLPEPAPMVTDALIAGQPDGKPMVLTWERAYALAVVRARSGKPFPGGVLDPKALDEQAGRVGMADFGRFRTEVLGGGDMFHDPSTPVYGLLADLVEVENARRSVAGYEALNRTFSELVKGEAVAVNRLQLDQVDLTLQQARRVYFETLTHLRDRLDEVKVALGLTPEAPVVPDRSALAAFRDVFDATDAWTRDPRRDLANLAGLAMRLPSVRDVTIDGRPLLATLEADDGQLDSLLTAAARLASRNRGAGAPPDLSLAVRRRARRLIDLQRGYELERRQFVLAVQMQNHAFERLIAPPEGDAGAPGAVMPALLDAANQSLGVRNRLVRLWAASQAERLALLRDLGVLPCDDWKAYYEQLAAVPSPVHAQVNPAPASAVPPVPVRPAAPAGLRPPSP